MSPQTPSKWRQRGTVPYEVAIKYAVRRGLSLDYVLLGRGPWWSSYGETGDEVLSAIIKALQERGARPDWVASWTTQVYRRIAAEKYRPKDEVLRLVDAELNYLFLASQTAFGGRG